jgi:hypothetical protein
MKQIIFLSFLLVFSLTAVAQKQSQKQDEGGQPILDKFFELYKQSPESALKYIFGTNKWMAEENTTEVMTQLQSNIDMLGGYIDYELLKSRKVGSRFRIVSYFVYYDRQPLRLTFELYRNNEGWTVWNFKYDSSFDDEIEESMKFTERN